MDDRDFSPHPVTQMAAAISVFVACLLATVWLLNSGRVLTVLLIAAAALGGIVWLGVRIWTLTRGRSG